MTLALSHSDVVAPAMMFFYCCYIYSKFRDPSRVIYLFLLARAGNLMSYKDFKQH